ncbi:MAG: hypothetical protein GY743_20555, partial [Planctomycetaceae bacterium]|nr:hypothetical protein [Planctomycetaceae bacterium]
MGKKKMFINNNNVSANPNQITEVNQIAWYDFTDETTLTLSTDLIQTVTDKYGNHNLTSPSGKEPTLEDGFAKFNTDGKQLIASTTFPSNLTSTGFYVFMRWKDAELNGGLNGAGMIL